MADFPSGSDNWCPVCCAEILNVDKHLKSIHSLKPHSEEQRILCSLGTDRTPVEGEEVLCPLFRKTGCVARVKNVRHHVRNKHKEINTND